MFDFTSANLDKLVIHQVGNKLRDEGIFTSPAIYEMKDGNIEELLLKYFLTPFKDNSLYKFFHNQDIHANELYMRVSNIFIKPESFYEESINILKHLYDKSSHPQIRGGEFYMAYFKDCIINDQRTDAVGIFKTEKKGTYLKITKYANEFTVGSEKCIDVKKLDKGCIIFNVNSEDGYRVAIVDAVNKGDSQALYWKDDFLQLTNVQDSYFHTERHLQICKDFAENIYGTVYQADKKEQVAFINEAITYFDKHSEFDLEDFTQEVILDPELVEQFKEHKQNYDLNQGIKTVEQFSISTPAVKTAQRKLKNLIKLDTDFEIKMKKSSSEDGNKQHIVRGFDEVKGMHYYKVYFNEEE